MANPTTSGEIMKGDIIVLEKHHIQAASVIVPQIVELISAKAGRYVITVAGESGSGKSETGKAIADELARHDITSVLLGQDDYFELPPESNDAKRRDDDSWLGPHVEVRFDVLEQNLIDAINKPLVDYDANSIEAETIDLQDVKVLIAEGTYTTLLKNVDTKVFIARNRVDTLEHRQKRNRGTEVGDPFIENVLELEHKIIAGHRQLADFVITRDYDVISIGGARA
jgi:uridine kinase